jgi:hypothetical protein
MLSLTPAERLRFLQNHVNGILAISFWPLTSLTSRGWIHGKKAMRC